MPWLLTQAFIISVVSSIELNITPVLLENKLRSIPPSANDYRINFRDERFESRDTRAGQR